MKKNQGNNNDVLLETSSVGNQKRNKATKITIYIILAFFIIVILIYIFMLFGLNYYFTKNDHGKTVYALSDDLNKAFSTLSDNASDQIKQLPVIYAVPIDQYVAPMPKKENYSKWYSEYSDETITAKYYSENYYGSIFHFIDVTIAHPSQLRMAWAGNKYGKARKYPQTIAKEVNAVAAVDGSYYNVRSNGVLYYQGNLYRSKAIGWDILLIDSEGDLHVAKDKDIVAGKLDGQFDIVNSVTFGPALVLDGKVQPTNTAYGFPNTLEPRAAIAQLGKLHYLICTVDGRQEISEGVTQHQLAVVLAKKGCQLAYNLDGGQSATLIMGNHVKNNVAYGGQRRLGDILYFATALSE